MLQDLLLPGGMDGIETTRRVLERLPGVRVIALTASLDEARMMGVLRAGAAGYVRKDADPEMLLAAVRTVARGKTYIDPSVARQVLHASTPDPDDLTARELEVLRRLALGHTNKAIAAELCIGEETVKTHIGKVLAKLDVENRAQASSPRSSAGSSRSKSCSSYGRARVAEGRPGPPEGEAVMKKKLAIGLLVAAGVLVLVIVAAGTVFYVKIYRPIASPLVAIAGASKLEETRLQNRDPFVAL